MEGFTEKQIGGFKQCPLLLTQQCKTLFELIMKSEFIKMYCGLIYLIIIFRPRSSTAGNISHNAPKVRSIPRLIISVHIFLSIVMTGKTQ